MKLYLRDLDAALVEAWSTAFAGEEDVVVGQGDIFETSADVLVSPANSFGFMDGGIDLVYSRRLGWHVQEELRAMLARDHDGELMVGLAVWLETGDEAYPILISAPTMRAPDRVDGTLNAFLAFRATLRCVQAINAASPGRVGSVLCPGLGTATGGMHPVACARQMHAAWREIMHDELPDRSSINAVITEHYRLLRTD